VRQHDDRLVCRIPDANLARLHASSAKQREYGYGQEDHPSSTKSHVALIIDELERPPTVT
jgi:hypothetical protein